MVQSAIDDRVEPTLQQGGKRRHRGWWGETFTRLVHHRLSAIALVVMTLLVLSAILAPLIAPYNRFEMDFTARLQGPSLRHLLGTDETGRDLLSRIMWGGRISLGVALCSVLMSSIIGVPWGMVAAYRGGRVDDTLMRICDAFMAFPSLVFALLVVAALGPSIPNLILTIGILGAMPYARIARSAVLSERPKEYVTAAIAIGAKGSRVVVKHILPNCVAPLVVQISLGAAERGTDRSGPVVPRSGRSAAGSVVGQPAQTGLRLPQAQRLLRDLPGRGDFLGRMVPQHAGRRPA